MQTLPCYEGFFLNGDEYLASAEAKQLRAYIREGYRRHIRDAEVGDLVSCSGESFDGYASETVGAVYRILDIGPSKHVRLVAEWHEPEESYIIKVSWEDFTYHWHFIDWHDVRESGRWLDHEKREKENSLWPLIRVGNGIAYPSYRIGSLAVGPVRLCYGNTLAQSDVGYIIYVEKTRARLTPGVCGFRAACSRAKWLATQFDNWESLTPENSWILGKKQHITKVLTGQWTVAQAEKHINKRASKDQE